MLNTNTYVTSVPLRVSKVLQEGEKFMKWDDDSGTGTPVTLKVDKGGFFLYWVDQNNEMDILDIATIRDVRSGPYARKPKDAKLRQLVTMGSQDKLEEKTITICYGSDFVNVIFINFSSTRKEIAQQWTSEILCLVNNLNQYNGSVNMFLQKAHTRILLQSDKNGNISVKNIVKFFAQNKDDRRRVEKALENIGLPFIKTETIPSSAFSFDQFYKLYYNLTCRNEVEKIFDAISGKTKRKCLTTSQFVNFLNKTQRDPRLNEILHPYANVEQASEIIHQYEPNKFNVQKGYLSLDGFLRYLISDDNPVMVLNKLEVCDDMEQPLSHYFINSSHNTYLAGHQLTGKSSVEIYRQCLLAGCRCLELDFWNGRTEEPVIVHGYTFVPEIFAKDVLEAIAESAFKTSEYPVILSFENHCNPKQQAKIANYCREIFGDMLLDKPLESHPLEINVELPSPSLLKKKIIIKNKKKHYHHKRNDIGAIANKPYTVSNNVKDAGNNDVIGRSLVEMTSLRSKSHEESKNSGNHLPYVPNSKDSTTSTDSESSSEEENLPNTSQNLTINNQTSSDKVQKEAEAVAEISALVNYIQPVHFSSFELAEKKSRYYEMSSFDERQAMTLLKERPIEFVNYNKHQLSRIYPAGTRFDSSNFMPQLFWNAGCQLVALNFQTLDLAMQLNLGLFELNGRCGYLLKPEFMRRVDRRLDPFAESTVDGIIAGTVSITVISGQFLSDKKVGTYIEVDMFGLPADTVRKKFRTKIIRDNGINPVFAENPFVFKKVVLPELASIRIAAYEENGKLIGHRVLPVIGLCPGYRHLNLRNELGQPLPMASLFLCIVVKDYIPDDLSNFAEALANPIKYQNELEKRDKQLAVLTEDTELSTTQDIIPNTCKQQQELTPLVVSNRNVSEKFVGKHLEGGVETIDAPAKIIAANNIQQQLSIDCNISTCSKQIENSIFNTEHLQVEPLESILNNKIIHEKCLELERKLDAIRKKHDKEKVKIVSLKSSPSQGKRKKFGLTNKLVKRLSSRTLESFTDVPPCAIQCTDVNNRRCEPSSQLQHEKLLSACRDYSRQYHEMQIKYIDIIYSAAEKIMIQSQATQVKLLKATLDKSISDMMHDLQETRKHEVKNLTTVRRDKDEFERMKREVASTIVERGVMERMRLKENFEKCSEKLQIEHDLIRRALRDHKAKAINILDAEKQSSMCVNSNGFLSLFQGDESSTTTSNNRISTKNLVDPSINFTSIESHPT